MGCSNERASVRYRTRSGSDGIQPLSTWVEQVLALLIAIDLRVVTKAEYWTRSLPFPVLYHGHAYDLFDLARVNCLLYAPKDFPIGFAPLSTSTSSLPIAPW